MICPNCESGKLFPAVPHKNLPADGLICEICNGTGELPDYYNYLPDVGRIMKEDRLRRDVRLRDEAIATGKDVGILSREERGYFKKGGES